MNTASSSPSTSASAFDAAMHSAYQWLLILGFPANEAAASLMPDLFTDAVRVPEIRPGALRLG